MAKIRVQEYRIVRIIARELSGIDLNSDILPGDPKSIQNSQLGRKMAKWIIKKLPHSPLQNARLAPSRAT